MGFKIINPGILTTIQDLGRVGYQEFGVSVSGAMDPRAFKIANILAGNEENEACLECTMMGPMIQFDQANVIGLSGADLGASLDGTPIKPNSAVKVEAGQTLRFMGPKAGIRAYIAFAGGMDIPVVMGSRSTNMKAKIGGLQGRKLQKNDEIGFRDPKDTVKNLVTRHFAPEVTPRSEYIIRVLLGPQDDYFTKAGIETFFTETYTVTPEFDRMGCRLEGKEIEHVSGGDIISDGICFGAIQVPGAGKPIIMLADRQTAGGYTKIANVITADFRLLAQLKAGDKVRFEKVSIAAAQDALLTERRALRAIRRMLDGN